MGIMFMPTPVPIFIPVPAEASAPVAAKAGVMVTSTAGKVAIGVGGMVLGTTLMAIGLNETVRHFNGGRSLFFELNDMWRIWKEVEAEMKAKQEVK